MSWLRACVSACCAVEWTAAQAGGPREWFNNPQRLLRLSGPTSLILTAAMRNAQGANNNDVACMVRLCSHGGEQLTATLPESEVRVRTCA